MSICRTPYSSVDNIRDVKLMTDGSPVHMVGKVVSKRLWGDRFYVIEPDRSCGIGILSTAVVSPGQILTIDGTRTTAHGEDYVSAAYVEATSSTAAPQPLGMSSRSFLSGLSSTGMPVKVWGKTTAGIQSDSLGDYFTLGDGGPAGVRVYVGNTGVGAPSADHAVSVSGISSMNVDSRVVLISSILDIQAYYAGAVDPEAVPEWVWSTKGLARVPFDLSAVTAACTDGADAVEVPVQDTWYSYYPSTVATPSPTYGSGALLGQIASYAHNHGAKLVGTMPACKDASCLTARTDWRQRPTDSTSWLTAPADQVTGCLVSPYGDYLIDEIKELAGIGTADGVSLQGYSNTQAFCYCSYCKARYLADTGYSIPASVNYDDPNFRRYLLWHDAQMIDHFTRLRAQVRAVNPNFGIFAWSANAGEYPQYSASPHIAPTGLDSLLDCTMQNAWYDDANMGLSVVPEFGLTYLAGLTRHRPCIAEASYLTHTSDSTAGVSGSSMPEAEIEYRMLSALAAGCATSFSSVDKQYMRPTLFSMAAARSPWTNHASPMKWAAVVVSETTRQFYGRTDAVNKYMGSCFGFFRAMLDHHFPVDIITESDLEAGLATGYKVLILPNTACMSAASMAAVRDFVAAGGGLVATGSTSLYDEQGVARSDFGLADLFKASKMGSSVSLVSRATVLGTVFTRNQAVLSKMLNPYGNNSTYIGDAIPVSVTSGGAIMATVCSDSACTVTYPLYVSNSNTGAGRVAYLPAGIDAAFYKCPYPYEGVLLADAVSWATSAVPRVTIVGPKSLQATFFTQNNGKRIVIHLLNATNSRGAHALPTGDVPVRDEVVPLSDIQVWFEDVTPSSITLQPENAPLTPTHQGGRTEVIVGTLQQHSMVVADIP